MAIVAKSINTALNSKNSAVTIAYGHQVARRYEDGRKDLEPARLEHLARIIHNHTHDLMSDNKTDTAQGKMLDLGCGTGVFTVPLSERLNLKVTGADSSSDMLEIARAKKRS